MEDIVVSIGGVEGDYCEGESVKEQVAMREVDNGDNEKEGWGGGRAKAH